MDHGFRSMSVLLVFRTVETALCRGGYFSMSNNENVPLPNRSILNEAQIIKAVGEAGTFFTNAKEAVYTRNMLEEIGHHQLPREMLTSYHAEVLR